MRLKHATPKQIKKVTELIGDGIEIMGVLILPSGDEFIQLEKMDKSDLEMDPPITGFSVFALPVSLLEKESLNLYDMPRVCLSLYPTDIGSEGYLFREVVMNHIAKTYPELESNSLFCIELDTIHMAEYRSNGLGSFMLSWAIDGCREICATEHMVITHVFGEVVPDDDDRLKDVIRFYHRNGFREAYGFIYRMFYQVRADMSKSL